MTLNIYFSRPGSDSEIYERLELDVKFAQERIYVAQNYLVIDELRQLILRNEKCHTLAVLDIGKNKGVHQTGNAVFLGDDDYSHMHHKFIIIDDVVWIGSLNFSSNAHQNNWESMVRIQDEEHVVEKYLSEFKKMYIAGKALQGKKKVNKNQCVCGQNHPITDIFHHLQTVFACVNLDIRDYVKQPHRPDVPLILEGSHDLEPSSFKTYSICKHNGLLSNVICKEVTPLLSYDKETRCGACSKRVNKNAIHIYKKINRELHIPFDYVKARDYYNGTSIDYGQAAFLNNLTIDLPQSILLAELQQAPVINQQGLVTLANGKVSEDQMQYPFDHEYTNFPTWKLCSECLFDLMNKEGTLSSPLLH